MLILQLNVVVMNALIVIYVFYPKETHFEHIIAQNLTTTLLQINQRLLKILNWQTANNLSGYTDQFVQKFGLNLQSIILKHTLESVIRWFN